MPPKRNERGKKNRKAKANGTSTHQTTVVSKRSPPTRKAKARAGKAVKKTVTSALSNNTKPLNSVGKRKSRKADPIFFTAESGIQYRIGDYAYVDAERSDLPYHICRIRDLKTTRKEHVVADVTWFYRPSEVPESIYLHLLDDQQDEYGDVFKDKRIRERQLFISLSCLDLRPLEASLFRGKCEVFQLTKETQIDLDSLFDTKDQFFYSLAYNQESRQFTFVDKESVYSSPYIPFSQQASLPELRDFPPAEDENDHSQLVWEPKIGDEQLLTCLRAARSIALHAGYWINGNVQDGYLAASSDQTTQTVFDMLYDHDYKSDKVLTELVKKPMAEAIISKKQWGHDEMKLFAQGVRQYGKHFSRIQKEYLPHRTNCEMIEFYYHWKKTPVGLDTRGIRKQKKQHHIKTARQYYSSQQDSGQEYADVCSAEEDEGSEETERDMSYYVCAHCGNRESSSWHHAGPKKYLLCDNCRLYYNKYGEMIPLKEQTDSPDSNYKSYCQATQPANTKARQGTKKSPSPERAGGGGPTLRSGRVCKPSDTSEESTEEDYDDSGEEEDPQEMNDEMEPEDNEESDYSEDSYTNSHLPAIKKQPCRSASLLVHLRDKETDNMTELPAKRPKLDKSGHGLEESGQASSNQISSMSSSPTADASSAANHDSSHASSFTSAHAAPDSDIPLDPSRFNKIPLDADNCGCARTNIVYVGPRPKPITESEAAGSSSSTSKTSKAPQTPMASTPSMQQHTPLISVYTPTMIPSTTPFAYPSMVPTGEAYSREQAAAMGLQFQRPEALFEQQRMQAELNRMMYHKQQQQQQQHNMQMEGHMMSPALAQHHQYFQGMVAYPDMLAALVASGNNEEAIRQQHRIMAAAAASQVAQPQTPNPDLNHFQFDPRVLMQYGALHNQEEMYMSTMRAMEFKLMQFTQQIMMHQQNILQPEFAAELQRHYDMFRYLMLQNPANHHNPVYQQIGQVLEHCLQQRAAMEHPVRTGVIVNSNH